MLTSLAAPVAAYLVAANAHDSQATADCFAEDAIVYDEGREWRGRDAIKTWKEDTDRKYHPLTEAIDIAEVDGRSVLTARVSGTFPGSPIDLRYAFTLDAGRIAALDIDSA